jgi:DNA-binding NtrC family response regulator
MTLATQTLAAASYSERWTLPRFRLRVLSGPAAGQEQTFARRQVYVGTAPDCDFVVADPSVSRTHLRIDGERSGYRLTDLDSKNGTWFAGARLGEVWPVGSAVLRLGQSELAFEPLADLHEVWLATESRFGGLLGESAQMRELFAVLARTAPTSSALLIVGEPGVGKELLAESVHQQSRRAQGPFVSFDAATVAGEQQEAALFGDGVERGVLAEASGGTLYLDEIEALAPAVQARLARTIGLGTRSGVDVRWLASATDLPAALRTQSLRTDLLEHLAVVRVEMPPLRRRREDIPLLVNHFLDDIRARTGSKRSLTVAYETMLQLQQHSWPGNVRELRNHLERAAALAGAGDLQLTATPATAALPWTSLAGLSFKDARAQAVDHAERAYLVDLLQAHPNAGAAAARAAGLSRRDLDALLDKWDLRPIETT